MKLYKCSGCNYMVEAEDAPHVCPKCGAPKEAFKELSEDEKKLVYMSDRTNDLLMKLDALCVKMLKVAEEGLDIKLDPTCVKTFDYAKQQAWIIKQMAKSEIESHVKKGKW